MRVAVEYPDLEPLLREFVMQLMQDDVDAGLLTVSVGMPTDWTKGESPDHVEVAWRVTTKWERGVALWGTCQLIVHASTIGDAKRWALKLFGLVDGPSTFPGLSNVYCYTGPLPARDPITAAEVCSFDVGICVRATPVSPGS